LAEAHPRRDGHGRPALQAAAGRVAFVLKGYPRLSETFIAQEIHALEQRGLDILIASLRLPTDKTTHPIHAEIRAPLLYLPEYLYHAPMRVLRAWWHVRRLPGYAAAWRQWLRDLWRDRTANRGRRFGQALVLAHELPADIVRLHAHFLHTPASVTRYAAMVRGLPWSGSAHAKDIWTSPQWELRDKLAHCEWLVTCTATNRDYLASLAPRGRVELLYHGLDLLRFPYVPRLPSTRDGSSADAPVMLLSVGRLVEKKGTDVLLKALAGLPSGLHWKLVHVGGGPLGAPLKLQAEALGIADRITWNGAMAQKEILALYRQADLFVLASRIAADGDRDGLPNVLMEAQSQAVACVATEVSAIGELVLSGQTGLLVPQEDPAALAGALKSLVTDPVRREALGQAGRARVEAAFGLQPNVRRLAGKFGLDTQGGAPSARAAAKASR
jgi:glycosyltransferase involved in cell wall biosynthesis